MKIHDFCDELEKRNLKVTWDFRGRVNGVTRESLEHAKKTGLRQISFGVETGSDEGLKFLRKGSRIEKYRDAFRWTRELGIKTVADFIIGFPGETEEEFKETLEVMETVRFDSAYTFKYSSRPGTKAAEYTDQVSEEDKQNRLEHLIALQRKNTLSANLKQMGKTLAVMVEKVSKKSDMQWAGRTNGNMWVVFDRGDEQIKDIVNVKIEDAQGITLFGSRINIEERIHEAA